jgi:hypothetical protein
MQGVMIGDSYSVTQRGTWTQGVDSRFCRNAFLANTALILLCYIWRVLVIASPRRKLLSGQPYRYGVPELVLTLPKSHRRISTKK